MGFQYSRPKGQPVDGTFGQWQNSAPYHDNLVKKLGTETVRAQFNAAKPTDPKDPASKQEFTSFSVQSHNCDGKHIPERGYRACLSPTSDIWEIGALFKTGNGGADSLHAWGMITLRVVLPEDAAAAAAGAKENAATGNLEATKYELVSVAFIETILPGGGSPTGMPTTCSTSDSVSGVAVGHEEYE